MKGEEHAIGSCRNFTFIILISLIQSLFFLGISQGQTTNDYEPVGGAPPPALDTCNGVFLSYAFISREKEFPHTNNATAQAWAFKAIATIVNTAEDELKGWNMYVGFQHREILVAANGAFIVDGDDFPASVGNGTTFGGSPQADLKTSIETAGDYNQIAVQIDITGTQFGVRPPGIPMPKEIKLLNDGYKCPKATMLGKTYMQVCCQRDKKAKLKTEKPRKFAPRQYGHLSLTYDVLQAYENNYLAQVTIDNNHPLGRLDHWNLTWEWQNGEFITAMRGAYTRTRDYSNCVYGPAGKYYTSFDFSTVMTCDKKPVITDLPATRYNDTQVGKIPYCCRNGSILPSVMDPEKSRSSFQLQVYKLPPLMHRTALEPPLKWNIEGVLNPKYKCGTPIRVDPTQFPDSSGLQATSFAIATWQVACNITRPVEKQNKCCVSFSAYYNESVIPCNTCACGCEDNRACSDKTNSMLLPPEALLVPFDNRTEKAEAWAKLKHMDIPNPKPCPDNCPVSINWHVSSNYRNGWNARITLFNWEDEPFENWFAAIQIDKAFDGYENVYSFNGTKLENVNKTIFLQGLPGLNYLMGEVNGSKIYDPRVPGKQQSVISFTKKHTPGIKILKGDGFPNRVYFNGEECALPTRIPMKSSGHKFHLKFYTAILLVLATFVLTTQDRIF